MKQGSGNSTASAQKREPISHAVDVCSVADMGNQQACAGGGCSKELYEGRGFAAPGTGIDTHRSGSQGKH